MKSSKSSSFAVNRRRFLKTSALAATAVTFGVPALLRGQNLNSKINIATIGAAGKGASDTDHCATENIVALCDADQNHCAGQLKKYPKAKFYHDYRKMFDDMSKSIDAVIVATPDHFHAVAASAAIQLDKHIYCQKPLTQTIHEARRLRDLAREHKVISQMGNQGSAEDGLRRAVEVIQAGLIGPVREAHVWSNRPIWPQGMGRPEGSDPIPEGLDWDLWIGPAQMRPYKKGAYHAFNWRGWVDFGTGALGDMACHTVNMPFRALKMGFPTEIESETSGMNGETYPLGSKIRFQFPARAEMPALTFWWYDGGKPKDGARGGHDGSNKPSKELTADVEAARGEVPGSGCLIIGDKGQIFSDDDYGTRFYVKLKGEEKLVHYSRHEAVSAIPVTLPRNPFKGDADARQHLEWLQAIRDTKPGMCFSNFDIAADLTEIMLLGCVAMRVGKKLEWDGPNMRAKNAPEAAKFVKRDYRAGWKV
ncbi:MAG TPA: Gfo/Idh/MocA family oxidoreductase [Verrucomicrobiae bacterium]|nr:Gfo/Idh/MocA family oxidoreductase [Verrucomicrobiae bacterium]